MKPVLRYSSTGEGEPHTGFPLLPRKAEARDSLEIVKYLRVFRHYFGAIKGLKESADAEICLLRLSLSIDERKILGFPVDKVPWLVEDRGMSEVKPEERAPALLAECKRQREEIARLRAALLDTVNATGLWHDCHLGWMACQCGFAKALRTGNAAARAALAASEGEVA